MGRDSLSPHCDLEGAGWSADCARNVEHVLLHLWVGEGGGGRWRQRRRRRREMGGVGLGSKSEDIMQGLCMAQYSM